MGRPTVPPAQRHPNSKHTMELQAGAPSKPSGLSPAAAVEWDRLLAELEAAGLLITVAHRAPLTLAATIAADIKEAYWWVRKDGAYIETAKGGLISHPASKRIDALRRDYIKVLGMLGLRAAVSGDVPADDDLDSVLNG